MKKKAILKIISINVTFFVIFFVVAEIAVFGDIGAKGWTLGTRAHTARF